MRRALTGADGLLNAERFLQDLRNASFLVRPGEERFQFAHTSVREYFLANAIHRAIIEKRFEVLDLPVISQETIDFILARQAIAETETRDAFLKAFPELLTENRGSRVRGLGFDIWLASGANLPRPPVMDLSELDLRRRIFRGNNTRLLPLRRTPWRGTKLRQTEFDHVDLQGGAPRAPIPT